jgi:hypothetical protein
MHVKRTGSFYIAAFSGALYSSMLASPASADFISPGMADSSGQSYSQGMIAGSGPWGGEIYSQGMMMSTGDIYSQGMEITMFRGSTDTVADGGGMTNSGRTGTVADSGGTTNSEGTGGVTNLGGTANAPPSSQGCLGSAPNCTDNVTGTPSVLGSRDDGAADLFSGSAGSFTFVSSGLPNVASADPIPEPAGLALLAPALLWLGLCGRRRRDQM